MVKLEGRKKRTNIKGRQKCLKEKVRILANAQELKYNRNTNLKA